MDNPISVSGQLAGRAASEGSQHPLTLASNFEDVEVEHLVVLIADMLHRLTVHNDQIIVSTEDLTRFHSRAPPAISILDYLRRIVQFANVERSCLLLVLHYVDLVCARLPRFSISSLTVHRFIIAAITCSCKALCDTFATNTHYAKVGGLSLEELNLLEREFLRTIDWRLATTRELIQQYYVNLVAEHPDYTVPVLESMHSVSSGSSASSDVSETDSSAEHVGPRKMASPMHQDPPLSNVHNADHG